jgi:predicted nucleic acid-binding protein
VIPVTLLDRLVDLPVPDARAALAFLDRRPESARTGVGFADLLILACAVQSGARLRTVDRALSRAWSVLGFSTG